jgi:hypothetical protein
MDGPEPAPGIGLRLLDNLVAASDSSWKFPWKRNPLKRTNASRKNPMIPGRTCRNAAGLVLGKACLPSNFSVILRFPICSPIWRKQRFKQFVAESANPCDYGDCYLLLKP